MLAEVRGMEDWAMRQFCRIKMDQSMIPCLYTLCYNGISKIILLIPCGQASSAKQRCIDHRLQMQCLTEHLCWLIDTLINWVHLLSLPLVHPCRLFCSRNARNTEAKTLHPEWRFTMHLNSVLRQTCLDCPCLASIWWSRLHCCLMCFVQAKVLFSVGARDESLYLMVFRLIMQYARTLPWTRNMMQSEAATVDKRHQSTIWFDTNETCAWVWLQVPNPVCLSQPIMHVWFSYLTESFVVGIFGCSMLFQNAMVLNFPCSSGCQSDHGSHWCFWFLSSEIGNLSLQGHLMHKINCHLRFLHVQHVLFDSVGVSVCLSMSQWYS